MSINVIAAGRSYSPNYLDRAWLAAEFAQLVAAQAWADVGGLAVHVALAVTPLVGLAACIATAVALDPLTEGPTAAELTAQVAALTAPGSDLQTLALRLAGAVARLEAV